MDKLKFINKITVMYLVAFIIVVIYGFLYFISPMLKAISDKAAQIDTLKNDIKTTQAQMPQKLQDEEMQRHKSLPTNIFDPGMYGYDITAGNAYLLDTLLLKVKETKNKVVEISFETENKVDNNIPQAANTGDNTLNKQLGSLLTNGPTDTSSIPPEAAPAALPIQKTIVKLDMVSTYTTMQALLEKLYTWKYLAGIKKIYINDESNDGGSLKATLEVELYIKTATDLSGSSPTISSSPVL